MNLSNLALSGMNAAQSRLITTGHNIGNAATEGYSRQSVFSSTAGSQATGAGFLGRGVQVDTVSRAYSGFLSGQLTQSQSRGAAYSAYASQIEQINNLFADRTAGISPAIQRFFDGIQTMAGAPADPAARQEVIGRASTLVTQINNAYAFVASQQGDVNTQLANTVDQVNSHVSRISNLNKEIFTAQAASGHAPNDLLDQRDRELTELNKLVNVKVVEQRGAYNLTFGNGQVLLSGDQQYPVVAIGSPEDPQRTVIATTLKGPNGKTIEVPISEKALTGGSISGLLAFRRENLDVVQADLGRIGAGLALAFNAVHEQGLDINGAAAGKFFDVGSPRVNEHPGNSGQALIGATFDLDGAGRLRSDAFEIRFDGSVYQVKNKTTGREVFSGASLDGFSIDGVTLSTSGTAPAAGDTWTLSPTANAGGSLKLLITDPQLIGAADTAGGSSNGKNALLLADLQKAKTLGGGTMSINEGYSQLVNKIGLQTQQNANNLAAQNALINQNLSAQQAVSGVNLNEEYINLDRFAEQFQASARLLDVSATLFDTLLGLKG